METYRSEDLLNAQTREFLRTRAKAGLNYFDSAIIMRQHILELISDINDMEKLAKIAPIYNWAMHLPDEIKALRSDISLLEQLPVVVNRMLRSGESLPVSEEMAYFWLASDPVYISKTVNNLTDLDGRKVDVETSSLPWKGMITTVFTGDQIGIAMKFGAESFKDKTVAPTHEPSGYYLVPLATTRPPT